MHTRIIHPGNFQAFAEEYQRALIELIKENPEASKLEPNASSEWNGAHIANKILNSIEAKRFTA